MQTEGKPNFYYDLFEGRLITGGDAYEDALAAGSHPQDIVDLRSLLMDPVRYVETLPDNAIRRKSPWDTTETTEIFSWIGREVIGEDTRVIDDYFKVLHKLGLGPSSNRIRVLGGYSDFYQATELPNAVRRGTYDHWDIDDLTIYVCNHARNIRTDGPTLVEILSEANQKGEGPSYVMIRHRVPEGIPWLLNRGGIYYFKNVPDDYYVEWGVDFKFSNNGKRISTSDLQVLSPKQLSPSKSPIIKRFDTMDNFNILVEDRYYTELDRITARNARRFKSIMQDIYYGILPPSLFVNCSNESELRQAAGKYELLRKLTPTMKLDELEELARHSVSREVVWTIMRYREDLRAIDIARYARDIDIYEDMWPNNRNKPVLKV